MNESLIKTYIPDEFDVQSDESIATFSVPTDRIGEITSQLYHTHGLQLKTITAVDERREHSRFRILYVFGVPGKQAFIIPSLSLTNTEEFPSITKEIHEASGYERRIHSFFGLTPVGHPSLRQILLHENWPVHTYPLRKDFKWNVRPTEATGDEFEPYEFQQVAGVGIYEIPVGPVHAGIIEPGHFRFSVAGEEIMLLEPKLGYKHKGIEKLFETLPLNQQVRLSERVSGDTSFTHSLAFCQAVEQLSHIEVPVRGQLLRVVFSELERLANHFNDIGFIMLDTGYSFGGSQGGRLRELIMQINERLSGSRFLRGVNTIGGVTKLLSREMRDELLHNLTEIHRDFKEVIAIALDSNSLLNRLSGTGKLDEEIARDHGVIGVAGRALGFAHDARVEYPYAAYPSLTFDIALQHDGDVNARWHVRVKEVYSSLSLLMQALEQMPFDTDAITHVPSPLRLASNSIGIGITEGWRGDITYVIVTDSQGEITRVDVRDPSFLNWPALGHAGKGNVVPDFPLINKSFDLSYSGNDL